MFLAVCLRAIKHDRSHFSLFVLNATVVHQEILKDFIVVHESGPISRNSGFFLEYDLKHEKNPHIGIGSVVQIWFFHFSCWKFLMSHSVQKAILSAWPWQIYPFAPCSLSLHSLLMTNVKRISPLHESSRSTRTKRVSRMAVIQSVSKLSDAHLHKESM